MRVRALPSLSMLTASLSMLAAQGCARDAAPVEGDLLGDVGCESCDVEDVRDDEDSPNGPDVDIPSDTPVSPDTTPDTTPDTDACPFGTVETPDGECVRSCPEGQELDVDGRCVPEGCSSDEHDGGDGRCVPLGTCLTGYEDGGDGQCLPAGSCSDGFGKVFVDADGDGVGGSPYPPCVALPPGEGFALQGGDCNDTDRDVQSPQVAWPDRDGDGYTGPAEEICASRLPSNFFASPSAAKWIAFGGEEASTRDGEVYTMFRGNTVDLEDDKTWCCGCGRLATCGSLVVRDLGLGLPENAEILGIEVVLRRKAEVALTPPRDATVALVLGQRQVGDNLASGRVWPTTFETVRFGGADILWGHRWTVAELNAVEAGVLLTTADALLARLHIDQLRLEVTYAADGQSADCDDGDRERFARASLYVDEDGDGFGTTSEEVCTGLAPPPGRRHATGDCYDGNPEAAPGATTYHETDRGDGSFDYDCDGEAQSRGVASAVGCGGVDGEPCSSTQNTTVRGDVCGEDVVIQACSGTAPDCTILPTSANTACR